MTTTSRREFFGSVLGTMVLSRSRLIARSVETQDEDQLLKRLVRLHSLKDRDFLNFKVLLNCEDGQTHGMPVVKTLRESKSQFKFVMDTLVASQELQIQSWEIVDDQGFILSERYLGQFLPVQDVLKIEHELICPVDLILRLESDDTKAAEFGSKFIDRNTIARRIKR